MEAVKGAVLGLLADAYQRRDRVALVAFRGDGAEVLLRPTGSVEVARTRLADLPTGGRTPLAAGIDTALDVATSPADRGSGQRPLLVLVSDGRATAALDGDPVAARATRRGNGPHPSCRRRRRRRRRRGGPPRPRRGDRRRDGRALPPAGRALGRRAGARPQGSRLMTATRTRSRSRRRRSASSTTAPGARLPSTTTGSRSPGLARPGRGARRPARGHRRRVPAAGPRAGGGRGVRRRPRRRRRGRDAVAAGGDGADGRQLPRRRRRDQRARRARRARASIVVDVGVATRRSTPTPGLVRQKVRAGTGNLAAGAGDDVSPRLGRRSTSAPTSRPTWSTAGPRCLVTGDMGIGNTTAAAARRSPRFTGRPAEEVDRPRHRHRRRDPVAQGGSGRCRASAARARRDDPVAVLAAVGGLEIAALDRLRRRRRRRRASPSSSTASSPAPRS